MLSEHPPLSNNNLVGELVGVRLANVGWMVGKVVQKLAASFHPLNFKVLFQDGDSSQLELRDEMFLSSAAHYAAASPEKLDSVHVKPGAWVMLRIGRTPVPRRGWTFAAQGGGQACAR